MFHNDVIFWLKCAVAKIAFHFLREPPPSLTGSMAQGDGHIEDVSSEIDRALEENFLSAKDGERLRGRLNFMESQLFGKLSQQAFRGLSRHVLAGGGKLSTAKKSLQVDWSSGCCGPRALLSS